MSDTELLASRVLAHRLFTECRQSPGPFKTLTPSIRSMRNLLEEIEDSIDESAASSGLQSRIADQVTRCHAILTQVRIELQETASTLDGNETAQLRGDRLSDLRTALDVACHQLSVAAHQAPSNSGVTDLRLNTDTILPMRSLSSKSASLSAASDDTHKLSTSSSAWSLVNPDGCAASGTGTLNSAASSLPEVKPSDEKQACSPTSGGSAAPRSASVWASTFALDPLSIPMEEATAFILGEDTGEETALSSSSVFQQQSVSNQSRVALPYPVTPTEEKPVLEVEQQARPSSANTVIPFADITTSQDVLLPLRPVSRKSSSEAGAPWHTPATAAVGPPSSVPRAQPEVMVVVDNAQPAAGRPSPVIPVKPAKLGQSSPALPTRAPPPPPPKPRRRRPRAPSNSRYVIVNAEPEDTDVSEESDDDLYTTCNSNPSSPATAQALRNTTLPRSASIPEVQINGAPEKRATTPEMPIHGALTSPRSRSDYRALMFNIPSASYNSDIPGVEALDHITPIESLEAKPPPLPKRPARYHSMRSAPASSSPWSSLTESKGPADGSANSPLQADQKHGSLKERRSALTLVTPTEELCGRWSWQRRSRSRSELDQTQIATAPQHRRSHSSLATLMRAEMSTTGKTKPEARAEPAPRKPEVSNVPPPIPPRPRRSVRASP